MAGGMNGAEVAGKGIGAGGEEEIAELAALRFVELACGTRSNARRPPDALASRIARIANATRLMANVQANGWAQLRR